MSFDTLCIGVVVISVVMMIATFFTLKLKKILNERAFVYGILASMFLMLCTNFLIANGDFVYLIVDSLFMGMVFYNAVSMFGLRMAKIHEDEKLFTSFFSGLCIIGNLFSVLTLGVGGFLVKMYANDPMMIEYFGTETIEVLLEAFQLTLVDYGYLLVVSFVVAIAIGYMAISMISYAIKNNTIKTILKSIFILSAFYIVNLFVPASTREGIITVVAYFAVVFAAYLLYKESKHDKPSIEIIIK